MPQWKQLGDLEEEMKLHKPSPKPRDVSEAYPHGEDCQGRASYLTNVWVLTFDSLTVFFFILKERAFLQQLGLLPTLRKISELKNIICA